MPRRSAFTLMLGVCPEHGILEMPFYPPPLRRDSKGQLTVDLGNANWLKDFEKRVADTCQVCGTKLTTPYFGSDPGAAKRQILDQLVGSLFQRYPTLRELNGASPEIVDAILRQTKRQIRVELSPGSPITLSPYLLAIGAGRDTADSRSPVETAIATRVAVPKLTYSQYLELRPGPRQSFMLNLLREQDGKCAVCGEVLVTRRGPGYMGPVVDHDHATGRIRGVLHPKCNTDLDVIENRAAEWHQRARAYLQQK